jgi:hypothetical protein
MVQVKGESYEMLFVICYTLYVRDQPFTRCVQISDL